MTPRRPARRTATVAAVLLLCLGCGGGDQQRTAAREHDGEALTALMQSAREAIGGGYEAAFGRLYAAGAQDRAKDDWKEIATRRWNWGEYRISRLTETPGLERKEVGLHVERLELHVWFDFTKDSGESEDFYRTLWSFVREDTLWRLDHLSIERNPTGYGQWIRGLHLMGYREFLALGMDWEEGYDQTPLLARAWQAVAAGDRHALKPMYVDGALLRAFEAKLDMPGVATGENGSGANHRSNASTRLTEQVKRMREATGILQVEPVDLGPFYAAYRVTSMPDDCTKLSLVAGFDGSSVPSQEVTRFSLMWTGVYLKSRWLVETMHAHRIHFN